MSSPSHAEVDEWLCLVKAGGAGRKSAITQLYRAFANPVARFLRARGVPDADVEDQVQEVFIALMTKSASFVPQGQGRGWFWTVVRSSLADRYRAAPPAAEDLAEAAPWLVDDAGFDTARLQACVEGQMAAYMRDQPEAAQALSWVVMDGLDLKAVAGLLNRSYGATREFMRQVRLRVRTYLEPCLSESP